MNELYHHGIQGQKWGIRRFQNEDGTLTPEGKLRYSEQTSYGWEGGVIKKGTTLHRVSIDGSDRTYDNKKYVSTNEYDHAKWEDAFVDLYKDEGYNVFDIKYKTLKDIKVATSVELGEKVMKIYEKDPELMNTTLSEIHEFIPYSKKEDLTRPDLYGSYAMAAQTKVGKQLVQEFLDEGYGAVADTHGWNTATDPLIILDPEGKLMKTSIKEYK